MSGRGNIPKVIDIDPFHGSQSVRRAGAARGAMCHIGQAPQRTRRVDRPHPPGRAILAASGVARRLKWPALRRDALLTGGKNPPQSPLVVKGVNIKDLWYVGATDLVNCATLTSFAELER